MALQTPTSTTSSSPSPTPPPRPPPPPPPGANEQHSSLSPAGSPPLILAFLAIGLFTGAMVIVFGWRRVFGRSLTFGSLPTSAVERKPTFILPAKPKLWDMWDADDVTWRQVSGGVGYHNGEWTKMMPLSARTISLDEIEHDEKIGLAAIAPTARPASLRTNLLDPRIHFLWRPWRRGQSQTLVKETYEPKSLPMSESTTSKTLQVGVAIIFPSAQHPIYMRGRTAQGYPAENKFLENRRNELPDFAIGLRDFDWK